MSKGKIKKTTKRIGKTTVTVMSRDRIGKQVRTLRELRQASDQRRAVVVPGTPYRKPTPARWLMNLPGANLFRYMEAGVYIWKAKR